MQGSSGAGLSIYQDTDVEVAELLEEEIPELNVPEYKLGQCLRRIHLRSLLERTAVGGLSSDGVGTEGISRRNL